MLGGEIDADLLHDLNDGRVDLARGDASRGADDDRASGALREQPCRHLAPSRVMDADEEDFGRSAHVGRVALTFAP